MKTRTGSGIEENWDDEAEGFEKPSEQEEVKEPAPDDLDDEKSDPNTDGLDDDPIEDLEPQEDEADGPEDEGAGDEALLQDPPEEQDEDTDGEAASSESKKTVYEEVPDDMPLFSKVLHINDDNKKKAPLDLSDTHVKLGERLRKYRKDAGLTEDDVYVKTHIVQDYLCNFEEGKYSELNGRVYAMRHLVTLCQCYGLSKSLQEELQNLLVAEFDKAGLGRREVQLPNPAYANEPMKDSSGILNKLPKIIIGCLLALLLILLIMAVVVPILSKSRKKGAKAPQKDVGTLVKPVEKRPSVLPVP